jgi:hypothetical protein
LEHYSLSLALFDYLPVLLSVAGLWLLAIAMGEAVPGARRPALLAVALVAAGGLSKATWKLTWVVSARDVGLLSDLLFILMAPGFILLACHLLQVQGYWLGGEPPANSGRATLAGIVIAVAALVGAWFSTRSSEGAWFFILLGAASLANIVVSGLLIRFSWGLAQRGTALLFLFSICLILALGNLSRFSAGSAPLQWLAEVLNTLAHGSFALAMWRLKPHIPIARAAVPT